MPVTPFHFGLGAALHGAAPRQLSFLAFCAANVLIDVESVWNLLQGRDPVHAFFHSYLGATLVALLTAGLGWLWQRWRRRAGRAEQPRQARAVTVGALLGAWTHVMLDSVMHADIRPLAPFSEANGLYQWMPLPELHLLLVGLGVLGGMAVWLRRLHAKD
ncbi:MAG TPA: metal-dependent hydrolase [Burkholderiaceae bacterium]|nr:metal-dependent hydrolase [Burkholderiaceae bacterium]